MRKIRLTWLNRHEIQMACFLCSAVVFYGTVFHYLESKARTQKRPQKHLASNPLKFFNNADISPTLNHSIFILVFINTIPQAFHKRQTIRETWVTASTSRHFSTLRVSCVFLIGLTESNNTNGNLATEATKHNDLLQINLQESYRNMIYKIWSGFKWARRFNPRYIVKADDDVYLNIPRLINWLDSMEYPRELYTGYMKQYTRVIRRRTHRWYVSPSEFSQRFFPPYCIGPLYIFSGSLLDRLLAQTAYIETFYVEDAYLGVVMRDIGIETQDDRTLFKVGRYGPYLMTEISQNREYLDDVIAIGERLDSEMIRHVHQMYNNRSTNFTFKLAA